MTQKLYLTNGMIFDFYGTCLSCEKSEEGYLCVLDRTAFFPGGGGQEADIGVLDGIPVTGMREDGDTVFHIIPSPLEVGRTVKGEIDRLTRFSRMQAHTGEHILSGIAHSLYGCENVGFHMGDDGVTVDFDRELSGQETDRLETLVNEAVFSDLPVRVILPTESELKDHDYRSKKEIAGQVRLVEIENIDLCACCAPHLDRTGRVGIVKILDRVRWRGGIRLKMLCGYDALADYGDKYRNNKFVAEALKVKQHETAEAFERYAAETAALKRELTEVRKSLMSLKADILSPTEENICLFERGLSAEDMRTVCNRLVEKCPVAAVFSDNGDGTYTYSVASVRVPLRGCAEAFNRGILGRGGGSDAMLTGRAAGTREMIEQAVKLLGKEI